MARLSHPNVVHAYDAGLYEGQVYIVLEYVEGETLTRWLQRQARSWREILDAFRAAGEGLASIHDANLAHGDFKPDNVLVARDGRIRITDFGLARPVETPSEVEVGDDKRASGPGEVKGGLTAAGGTPLFMAPEQRDGEVRNALTDQYSFSVALFLALFGRHPSDHAAQSAAGAPPSGIPFSGADGVSPVQTQPKGGLGVVPGATFLEGNTWWHRDVLAQQISNCVRVLDLRQQAQPARGRSEWHGRISARPPDRGRSANAGHATWCSW